MLFDIFVSSFDAIGPYEHRLIDTLCPDDLCPDPCLRSSESKTGQQNWDVKRPGKVTTIG
jgi:hypothetical protein